MALEDIFADAIEGVDGGVAGIAAGVGALILTPIVMPFLSQVGKPLAKAAIKESLLAYEKGKEFFAEATEVFEDLVAEAKAELTQDQEDSKSAQPSHPEIIVVND